MTKKVLLVAWLVTIIWITLTNASKQDVDNLINPETWVIEVQVNIPMYEEMKNLDVSWMTDHSQEPMEQRIKNVQWAKLYLQNAYQYKEDITPVNIDYFERVQYKLEQDNANAEQYWKLLLAILAPFWIWLLLTRPMRKKSKLEERKFNQWWRTTIVLS